MITAQIMNKNGMKDEQERFFYAQHTNFNHYRYASERSDFRYLGNFKQIGFNYAVFLEFGNPFLAFFGTD